MKRKAAQWAQVPCWTEDLSGGLVKKEKSKREDAAETGTGNGAGRRGQSRARKRRGSDGTSMIQETSPSGQGIRDVNGAEEKPKQAKGVARRSP